MRTILILALGFVLAAGSLSAAAENAETPTRAPRRAGNERKSKQMRSRPDTILVPLWLGNSDAKELNPGDFKAILSTSEAKVTGTRSTETPLLLFVAVDFSADLILTEAAKAAMVTAIQEAGPQVYLSLLRIPEQPMVIVDPTTDREKFAESLQTLPMSGRAGFFEMVDVITGVTNPVLSRNKVRAAVLYLTDSEIRNYRQDYTNPVINSADSRDLSRRFPDALIREKVSTLTNQLLRTNVPLFVVHLNYRSDPLDEAYQTGIKRLAQSTGGRSVFCRSIAEIPVAIGDMVNAIQAMGMLEVAVPDGVSGSVALSLESPLGPMEYRNLFDVQR